MTVVVYVTIRVPTQSCSMTRKKPVRPREKMDGLLQVETHYVQNVKENKMGKAADEIKELRRNEFNKLGIKDELLKTIKDNLSMRPSMLIVCNSYVNDIRTSGPDPGFPTKYREAAREWLLDEGFKVGDVCNKLGNYIGLEIWI